MTDSEEGSPERQARHRRKRQRKNNLADVRSFVDEEASASGSEGEEGDDREPDEWAQKDVDFIAEEEPEDDTDDAMQNAALDYERELAEAGLLSPERGPKRGVAGAGREEEEEEDELKQFDDFEMGGIGGIGGMGGGNNNNEMVAYGVGGENNNDPVGNLIKDLGEGVAVEDKEMVAGWLALAGNKWRQSIHHLSNSDFKRLIQSFYDFCGGSDVRQLPAAWNRMYDQVTTSDVIRVRFLHTFYDIRYLYLNLVADNRKTDVAAEAEMSVVDEGEAGGLMLSEEELGMLAAIKYRIDSFAAMSESTLRARQSFSSRFHPTVADCDAHFVVSAPDFYRIPSFERAVLFLMHLATKDDARLVVSGSYTERRVYMPFRYNGHDTHTYVPFRTIYPVCDVSDEKKVEEMSGLVDYVTYHGKDPISDRTSFNILIAANVQAQLVSYFNVVVNNGFPLFDPDRHVFSFRNGIYDTRVDRFYPYDEPIPAGLYACKFQDREFVYWPQKRGSFFRGGVPTKTDAGIPAGEFDDDWFDIPTPHFDRIFRTQWCNNQDCTVVTPDPECVMRFNWAFMAHSFLYEVNELDRWARTYTVIGGTASGKSIIMNTLSKLYPAGMIRTTSDKHEERFGLAALYGGYVWCARDIGENCTFGIGDFLSITTGEATQLCVKNKMAVDVIWKSPGMMFGNALFKLKANEYQRVAPFLRRIIYSVFRNPVPNRDDSLETSIEQELPLILLKMCRGYLGLVKYMNSNGINDLERVWPRYYSDNIGALRTQQDSLEMFLASGCFRFIPTMDRECRSNFLVPWRDFKSRYMAFCETNPEFVKVKISHSELPDCMRDRGVSFLRVDSIRNFYPQPPNADEIIDGYRRGRRRPGVVSSQKSTHLAVVGIIEVAGGGGDEDDAACGFSDPVMVQAVPQPEPAPEEEPDLEEEELKKPDGTERFEAVKEEIENGWEAIPALNGRKLVLTDKAMSRLSKEIAHLQAHMNLSQTQKKYLAAQAKMITEQFLRRL